jgi:hypothetical protein
MDCLILGAELAGLIGANRRMRCRRRAFGIAGGASRVAWITIFRDTARIGGNVAGCERRARRRFYMRRYGPKILHSGAGR